VGGIKEKLLAAHRSGLKTIILPARNQADLEELPDEVRQSLEFVFVETVDDILNIAFDSNHSEKRAMKMAEETN
jgi:ATP-dependent Lon protease